MKITISGEIGSGKGTVGKLLANRLNYQFYSMGDIRREIAKKNKMTIDELNKIGEKEGWTDVETDNYQKNELSLKENIIVEGRLSWYFIKNSKKIYLSVNPIIAAQRIFNDQRETEKKFNKLEYLITYNKKRKESDILRYKKYYQINPYEKKYYDLIIDTSNQNPEGVINKILKEIK